MKYRPDIDGLRAVAVLPVVLFHAGFDFFSGGFVGVDIFFVISGYLITRILMKEIALGKFTYSSFYMRRAKRLLPALLVVVLCSLVVGYFILLPDAYKRFSDSSLASLFFVSNFYFFDAVDYFSISAEFMPLLHIWSLSVEEQFYLIWPALLLFFVRGRIWNDRIRFFISIVLTSLIALLMAIYGTSKFPDMTFYMMPFRLWEFGIGAMVAYVHAQSRGYAMFWSN